MPGYYSQVSNTHFLQILFNIVQPSLSWLFNRPFSFWHILEHFIPTQAVQAGTAAVGQAL
jgi:hypothetical protein